jgi:hypothetical protein
MRIRGFSTFGYRELQDEEWHESFPDPSWEQIECAIRRLDANAFAGVEIAIADMYHDGGGQPSLHITGGNGEYIISYNGGGGSSVHYLDPNQANQPEPVGVVKRDQGVWVPANWVCRNLELVLAIARYFTETGRPFPDVQWG